MAFHQLSKIEDSRKRNSLSRFNDLFVFLVSNSNSSPSSHWKHFENSNYIDSFSSWNRNRLCSRTAASSHRWKCTSHGDVIRIFLGRLGRNFSSLQISFAVTHNTSDGIFSFRHRRCDDGFSFTRTNDARCSYSSIARFDDRLFNVWSVRRMFSSESFLVNR